MLRGAIDSMRVPSRIIRNINLTRVGLPTYDEVDDAPWNPRISTTVCARDRGAFPVRHPRRLSRVGGYEVDGRRDRGLARNHAGRKEFDPGRAGSGSGGGRPDQ